MSAHSLGRASLRDVRSDALTPGLSALGAGIGALLHSPLVLALAAAAGTVWIVAFAPEVLLVLLASEGSLKALSPFSSLPVDLLPASLALVGVACAVRIRREGLGRMPLGVLPMVLVSVLLFFAAMRTPEPGGTYKSVYFAVVGLTLVVGSVLLIRDTAGLMRACAGIAGAGIIVALAAAPGADPNLPLTIPGGNEITAALYPAFGAVACLTCLAARSGPLRLLAVPLGAALVAASLRAGSRGVLLALLTATAVAIVLLVGTGRRPVVTLGVMLLVLVGAGVAARDVVGTAALQRYAHLTTDPDRAYLRDRALTQALAHPLGNGIGTFGVNLPEVNPRPSVPYPHNVALEVFNESGVLALAALVALVACAAAQALRAARYRGWVFSAVALTFALVEAFASGSVNDDTLLWLTIGVALAAPQATRGVHHAGT